MTGSAKPNKVGRGCGGPLLVDDWRGVGYWRYVRVCCVAGQVRKGSERRLRNKRMHAANGNPANATLTVGCWNISAWTRVKAEGLAEGEWDVTALQETRLSKTQVERERTWCGNNRMRLHHGMPSEMETKFRRGVSGGVGFLAASGVALKGVKPQSPAWTRLHAARRLHVVSVAPGKEFPRGMWLVSVYAPLQSDKKAREIFDTELWEAVTAWDMNRPMVLMGDFNGVLDVRGERQCPLLTRLIGPGGPFVDAHDLAGKADSVQWTFASSKESVLSGKGLTRIDRVLVNRMASELVLDAGALYQECGHRPLWVKLKGSLSKVDWFGKQLRKPPEVLRLNAQEMAADERWNKALDQLVMDAGWNDTVVQMCAGQSLDDVSTAISGVMERAVELCGGWEYPKCTGKAAYSTKEVRRNRKDLGALRALLGCLEGEMRARGVEMGSIRGSHRRKAAPRGRHTVGIAEAGSWSVQTREALRVAEKRLGKGLGPDGKHATDDDLVDLQGVFKRALECLTVLKEANSKALADMRSQRRKRWVDDVPERWQKRPGSIYKWLRGERQLWWTSPTTRADGTGAGSLEEVDEAMRQFWAEEVLNKDRGVDADERWRTYEASEFGRLLWERDRRQQGESPGVWQNSGWSRERVAAVLGRMNAQAAPGPRQLPIAMWRCMPEEVHEGVANLLNLVEAEGRWPREVCEAYVAVIPKTDESTAPNDYRPITVMDVVYRLWARGVVEEWKPELSACLRPTVMGFRSGYGCTHLEQLVQDVIHVSKRQRTELWLVSFDIAKCYDSLPWWALFGTLEALGADPAIIGGFKGMYRDLTRRFRFGRLEGEQWRASNGLAQGCPASPDLLNAMYEPVHRWMEALAQECGAEVRFHGGSRHFASAGYADDIVLMARSWEHAKRLVEGFLRWCELLGLRVNVGKTQVWSNRKGVKEVRIREETVTLRSTFRVVGVETGEDERVATKAHVTPRAEKAAKALRRLRGLTLPSAVQSRMWERAILPMALYGCEVRDVRPAQLHSLLKEGYGMLTHAAPISLSCFRATETLSGPALGEMGLREPMEEVQVRQLRWALTINNSETVVGEVRRAVCNPSGEDGAWDEINPGVARTLREHRLMFASNTSSSRVTEWPSTSEEQRFTGTVEREPINNTSMEEAFGDEGIHGVVWTDGSVSGSNGGAAAFRMEDDRRVLVKVPNARSSSHAELVGMINALTLEPRVIVTDSLVSMSWIDNWGKGRMKEGRCRERWLVREFIATAPGNGLRLVKVKAHEDAAADQGDVAAMGNCKADSLAKTAVEDGVEWIGDQRFLDTVRLLSAESGVEVDDIRALVSDRRWRARLARLVQRRGWMDELYRVEADWSVSGWCFRMPKVRNGIFVYNAPPLDLKWPARIRCGALGTLDRVFRKAEDATLRGCRMCGNAKEDEEHVLFDCVASGVDTWLDAMQFAWAEAAKEGDVPPEQWFRDNRWPLRVGIIPQSAWGFIAEGTNGVSVLRRFHLNLISDLAERMRGRGEEIATLQGGSLATVGSEEEGPSIHQHHAAPARRDGLGTMRELVQWLMSCPHIQACGVKEGVPTIALVALWEVEHGCEYPVSSRNRQGKESAFSRKLHTGLMVRADVATWVKSEARKQAVMPGFREAQRWWSVRVLPSAGEAFNAKFRELVESTYRKVSKPRAGTVDMRYLEGRKKAKKKRRTAQQQKPAKLERKVTPREKGTSSDASERSKDPREQGRVRRRRAMRRKSSPRRPRHASTVVAEKERREPREGPRSESRTSRPRLTRSTGSPARAWQCRLASRQENSYPVNFGNMEAENVSHTHTHLVARAKSLNMTHTSLSAGAAGRHPATEGDGRHPNLPGQTFQLETFQLENSLESGAVDRNPATEGDHWNPSRLGANIPVFLPSPPADEAVDYVDAYVDENGDLIAFEECTPCDRSREVNRVVSDYGQQGWTSPFSTSEAGMGSPDQREARLHAPPPQLNGAGVQQAARAERESREPPAEDPPRGTHRVKAGRATTEAPG